MGSALWQRLGDLGWAEAGRTHRYANPEAAHSPTTIIGRVWYHKKIACIKGPPDWTPTPFYLGWFKGLTENGLPLGSCYEGDWSPQSGYAITRSLIKHHLNDFTAIVVQNDLMPLACSEPSRNPEYESLKRFL